MLLDSNMQIIKGLPTRLNNSKMSNESQDSRERERAGEALNFNANSERPHCEIYIYIFCLS